MCSVWYKSVFLALETADVHMNLSLSLELCVQALCTGTQRERKLMLDVFEHLFSLLYMSQSIKKLITWVHSQSQRGISCVQQEFSSSVGAHHRHCLLVKAHLKKSSITNYVSDTKLTVIAFTSCSSLHGSEISCHRLYMDRNKDHVDCRSIQDVI